MAKQDDGGPEMVSVPKSALDWLFGEGPDANGIWFGDEAHIGLAGKFWWRQKFRRMLAAERRKEKP